VFFVVYNAAGNLQNAAALDRVGLLFANAFVPGGSNPPNLGTPGVNFNNHIPSNCVSCHGGQPYDATGHTETGSLFLPFDLDQFDYSSVPGQSRNDQLTAFKHLNEMVWKVAARSGSDSNGSVKNQLDGWYHNAALHQSDNRSEVFENNFDSTFVPAGWQSASSIYTSVVRPSCRNCHMANVIHPFDTEAQFTPLAGLVASDLCGYRMPHSLQSVRLFWQSGEPAALEAYWNQPAVGQSGAANQLHGCGPGNVATLDPPAILASFSQ
jgi:hypothetical protein